MIINKHRDEMTTDSDAQRIRKQYE